MHFKNVIFFQTLSYLRFNLIKIDDSRKWCIHWSSMVWTTFKYQIINNHVVFYVLFEIDQCNSSWIYFNIAILVKLMISSSYNIIFWHLTGLIAFKSSYYPVYLWFVENLGKVVQTSSQIFNRLEIISFRFNFTNIYKLVIISN